MDQKKLLFRVAALIIFIFIANTLAMKFYWYYSIWWFDMPMHFLGGFWLAWATVLVLERLKISISYFKIFFGVLLVGAGWEFFEILAYNSPLDVDFNTFDTLSDLCFDLAGGAVATFFLPKQNGTIIDNVEQHS